MIPVQNNLIPLNGYFALESFIERRRKMEFQVGQVIRLKKQHPCGTNAWEIIRTGADFRLKCRGCAHQVMLARKLVDKNFKGFVENT